MSRTIRIACDRCSTEIIAGHSILKVTAGDLVKRLDDPLDLCSTCADLFLDWLRPAPFKLESSPDGVGASYPASGRTIAEKSTG
jgi:hypothetical protein